MNKQELLNILKKIKLDKDKFIIISDASLVLQDVLKETSIIELSVDDDLKIDIDNIIVTSKINDYKDYVIIDGYKVLPLDSIYKIKKESNNSKDKKIVKQLDLILGANDNYRYERDLIDSGVKLIAGVDEVGRGPLVGPVVAAACILPLNYHLDGLTDSKKLSEKKREEYADIIKKDAVSYAFGIIDAKKIDDVNIYEASKLAMIEALSKLSVKPEHVLIDAMHLDIGIPQTSIIKGDFLSESIAAASVLAKVERDHMMYELDKLYPEYEFAKHKGYPTKKHLEIIKKFGVLENYRFTYKPVYDLIYKNDEGEKENEVINK